LARAREWHSRGRGFDSHRLQTKGPMAENNMFSGSIDPEIAKLMGIELDPAADNQQKPDFNDLFENEQGSDTKKVVSPEEVDLSKTQFEPRTKMKMPQPDPIFSDSNFYKKVLTGEGEVSHTFHRILQQYLNTDDPKDRSLYRGKLIAAYWNLIEQIGKRIFSDLSRPKLIALRYGYILPTLLKPEQRALIASVIYDNDTNEPIYYADEWLKAIASGQVSASATDETKKPAPGTNQKVNSKLSKVRGNRELLLNQARQKIQQIESNQNLLKEQSHVLTQHDIKTPYQLKDSFNSSQRRALSEINNILRNLSTLDKELGRVYLELDRATSELERLTGRADELGQLQTVDNKTIEDEFNTFRQMVKMCVGRQGNHLPILMKTYMRVNIRDIATRENILNEMASIEQLDPGIFKRTFKRQTNRIIPYVIITPCYGDQGICWEPYEKHNKATSRGRIAIPMFPKDVKIAVITAMADLRWQVAKETAQHYWMEEGITGHYYQWFSSKRMRGDVKEYFIQDYILWITKEAEGTQKLDREVRGIFWRNLPFPDHLRENLKNRGYVYSELYKKDLNRSRSDGY
jgi:hypothetical protein